MADAPITRGNPQYLGGPVVGGFPRHALGSDGRNEFFEALRGEIAHDQSRGVRTAGRQLLAKLSGASCRWPSALLARFAAAR